ncbi:MAG: CoA-binding protein [Fibrobacteria bacterium]|nr:CoA-binding protein [Fibrobacteria bacterium]
MNVAIIGASNNTERTSFLAVKRLLEAGHRVFPVHPKEQEILGQKCYPGITDIKDDIHTISLYLNEKRSSGIINDLLFVKPSRIIFNPGAENEVLKAKAESLGIEAENACTLILLSTGNF